MLATVRNRDPRRADRYEVGPPPVRRETLDMARRRHYLVLLRRWAQERLPAGTNAARDAAEWIRDLIMNDVDAARGGSVLVRLRTQLLCERASQLRARVSDRSLPCSRVEQLIGRDHLHAWDEALARLARRQRELVILRVEFGLDYAAIAGEVGGMLDSIRSETVNALAALIDVLGSMTRRAA